MRTSRTVERGLQVSQSWISHIKVATFCSVASCVFPKGLAPPILPGEDATAYSPTASGGILSDKRMSASDPKRVFDPSKPPVQIAIMPHRRFEV
jgi:hypothetical protein